MWDKSLAKAQKEEQKNKEKVQKQENRKWWGQQRVENFEGLITTV